MDDSDFNRLMDDMSDSDSGSDSMPPTPNRSSTSHGSVEKAFMSKLAMSPPSFDDDGEHKDEGKVYHDEDDEAMVYSGPVKTPRTSPVPDDFSDYDDEDDEIDGGREESKHGEYALSSVDNVIMKDTYSDESSSLSDDVGGGNFDEGDSDDSEFDFDIGGGNQSFPGGDRMLQYPHQQPIQGAVDGQQQRLQQPTGLRGGVPPGMGYSGGVTTLSYNQQTFGTAFQGNEAKEYQNQVNTFGFRGATSAAIDRRTEDRIAIGAAGVYAAGAGQGFGSSKKGPRGGAEPKKAKERVRRKTSRDEDQDDEEEKGGVDVRSRNSDDGRGKGRWRSSTQGSTSHDDSAPTKSRSKSPDSFAEAKAPPPSPVPTQREPPDRTPSGPLSTPSLQRGLSLTLPGADGDGNGIYIATAGGLGGQSMGIESRAERDASLMRPVEKGSPMVKCYVVRSSNGVLGGKTYNLFLEPKGGGAPGGGAGGSPEEAETRFLISARKKGGTKSGTFLLTNDFSRPACAETLLGKLKGNWSGASYTVFNSGKKAGKAGDVGIGEERKELGVIFYEYDRMGPGKMKVCIPRTGVGQGFWSEKNQSIISTLGDLADIEKLSADKLPKHLKNIFMICTSKRPKWDNEQKGHVLNFKGRVTESSVKNFQLQCLKETGEATMLQFGRVSKNVFTLDFGYPLNALQAFSVALSSLDGKIADSKGFDMVKRMRKGSVT